MQSFGNEIDTRVQLFADPNTIVRRICREWTSFYEGIQRDGVFSELSTEGLLATTTQCSSDNGLLEYSQERLPFVAYPHEWSPSMFRDAAHTCLDLHEWLFKHSLCLIDSHCWNIVFDGATPRWVDITSISPYSALVVKASLGQFRTNFLNPLKMFSLGYDDVVRSMLSHTFEMIPNDLINGAMPRRPYKSGRLTHAVNLVADPLRRLASRVNDRNSLQQLDRIDFTAKENAVSALRHLRASIDRVDITPRNTGWSDYIQAGLEPLKDTEASKQDLAPSRFQNRKFEVVFRTLETIGDECNTVVDLASNKGLFTQVADMMGYSAAGMDLDPGAVDAMYQSNRRLRLTPAAAINDLVAPRDAIGIPTNRLADFRQRFSGDCALCLALTHHLFFGSYQMSFEKIAKLVASYCRKMAVVEFIPPTDSYLRENYNGQPRFKVYNEQNFESAMKSEFEILRKDASFPDGRSLWHLRKKP
jgi:hypothetical protein